MIRLSATALPSGRVNIYWDNNSKYIGYAYKEVDGFYHFCCEAPHGAWTANSLKCIANTLDKLNEPWQNKLNELAASVSPVNYLNNMGNT